MKNIILSALALVAGLGLAGCTRSGQSEPAAPNLAEPAVVPGAAVAPAAQAAAAGPAAAMLSVQGFGVRVPASWTPAQTSSSMRFAQFAIPPVGAGEAGEVAAFFFQTGNGGTQEMNIERWASHFAGADGQPPRPEVTVTKHGQTQVTLVELTGRYARGVGMGSEGEAGKPNQTLIVAMVEIPAGRITLQIYGPNEAVAAERANFLKVARGFKPV